MQRFELDDARIPLNGSGINGLKKKSDLNSSVKSIISAEQKIFIGDLINSQEQKKEDPQEVKLTGLTNMSQTQILKLRSLQDPKNVYDNFGNVLEVTGNKTLKLDDQGHHTTKKMTYFILKRFPIPIKRYVMILSLILLPAMFLERYFFIVAVYKARNYGFISLLTVLFFNTIFLFIM